MRKNSTVSLSQIIEATNGELISRNAVNSHQIQIRNLARLPKSTSESLSYVASNKYSKNINSSKAQVILVNKDVTLPETEQLFIVVDNVWFAMVKLLPLFYSTKKIKPGTHPSAIIGENVNLGNNVTIAAFVVIEDDVKIGDNCVIGAQCYIGEHVEIKQNTRLYPGVKILEDTIIGENCILHPGVVIGADGFAYEVINGLPTKIPQMGNVVLGNNVEVGANSCIDKAFLDSTTIGEGTKIDNLVQIGHNCEIGPYNGMSGHTAIGGSVKTGVGVMFWGQAGSADNLSIADYTTIGGQAGVISSITEKNTAVFGTPAVPHRQYFKMTAALRKLPDVLKKIK